MSNSLDDHVRILREGDHGARFSAALALGKARDPLAVQCLIDALSGDDFLIRSVAAQSLGKIGDPRAIPHLIGTWRELRDWSERPGGEYHAPIIIAQVLQRFGSAAVEPLIAVVRHDAEMRFEAARVLEEIGLPAVPFLLDVMQDNREEVKLAAVLALGAIGDSRAVPILAEYLKSGSPTRRRLAAEVLGKGKQHEAVPHLIKALKDDDEAVRREATNSLWRITGDEKWFDIAKTLNNPTDNVKGRGFFSHFFRRKKPRR